MRLLAIDPGEKHVGLCWDSVDCIMTAERTPAEAIAWLGAFVNAFDEVVIESFKLYPGQTRKTTYRKMGTSELIGAIKLLCRQRDVPCVEQDATIKKPMRRQLRARGIKQVGCGSHERDAELHYYRRKLGPPT